MKAKISKHAKKRATERGITEAGIRAILAESPAITADSKTDPDAVLVFGMYAERVWVVVLNYITNNVITARRARKNEEGLYYDKRT